MKHTVTLYCQNSHKTFVNELFVHLQTLLILQFTHQNQI